MRSPFFMVGLGASAGGLEALGTFFDAMPPDSGMAFVVIQHLSPTHRSMMAELRRGFRGVGAIGLSQPSLPHALLRATLPKHSPSNVQLLLTLPLLGELCRSRLLCLHGE